MKISRRQVLQQLISSRAALAVKNHLPRFSSEQKLNDPYAGNTSAPAGSSAGRFTNTRESLRTYTPPDWFCDAKFGIWSHWGPQSAIGDGDWYAHWMYSQGHPQIQYHVKRFGPPCKFGYKDTAIPLFTADKWDPEHLMDLYQKAGAKYFFSLAVHHDNYDLWNSKFQPRWNSVVSGPKRDIVGMWASATRRRGLRFGVSEHLSASLNWFATSHGSDQTGEFAGLPYDGADPTLADLYHDYSGLGPIVLKDPGKSASFTEPTAWREHFMHRIKDLIDQHQPDLLYTDGRIPYEAYGLATVAELYNVGPTDIHGEAQSVYFSKLATDPASGICVLDREAGVLDSISPSPGRPTPASGTGTTKSARNKTPKKVIDLLVDIVSKNGNLLLNLSLTGSGELDPEERSILETLTAWTSGNGEGIFFSRPWTIYGEGPAMQVRIDPTPNTMTANRPHSVPQIFALQQKVGLFASSFKVGRQATSSSSPSAAPALRSPSGSLRSKCLDESNTCSLPRRLRAYALRCLSRNLQPRT